MSRTETSLGVPPAAAAKYRSCSIPISRTIPLHDDSDSFSEGQSSDDDSEAEHYARKYPMNSSFAHTRCGVTLCTDARTTTRKEDHSDDPIAQRINQAVDQIPICESAIDVSTAKIESASHVDANVLNQYSRHASNDVEAANSSSSFPLRFPSFHASCRGPWHLVIAYDACVRLCLHSWARGCMEAPIFLENECALLRNSFRLQHILLQSEEELLTKEPLEIACEETVTKPKKGIGKMKVQVRKVRMALDMPSGCSISLLKSPVIKMESFQTHLSDLQTTFTSRWKSLREARLPRQVADNSFSRQTLAYMHAGAQFIKQVSGLVKTGVATLKNSTSYETVQETYSCHLRLKNSCKEDGVRLQPGTGETHVFFPDSLGDDLIIEIYDSKGNSCGRAVAQLASIAEDLSEQLHWYSLYNEAEHQLIGRIQLQVNYTLCADDYSSLKCSSVPETVAYDIVLEVAMKVQRFGERSLSLHEPWKWLLVEFASYYGLSDAYVNLRYLSYVMDIATPTSDCLMLVLDLLKPVILKSHSQNNLSHQEHRILGELEEQIEQILAQVFENYKSLDESLPSGIVEAFQPAHGSPAPALLPAVKLYTLLHDILSPEAQSKLCGYFQVAAKKILNRHLLEVDEFILNNTGRTPSDVVAFPTAYQKMKTLCFNIRAEIFADIELHNQHVFPSFLDLPNICASIYSTELHRRLRAFLVAFPPTGPSPPVTNLLVATHDFQKDLASWNICPVKEGVDAKELFHSYIVLWIQDRRHSLLDFCKADKVKWSEIRIQHLINPFADDMYGRLNETLNEYEVIICRWPEYSFALESAIADTEKAVVEALEKQYVDVLVPLKDNMMPKKLGFKYVQKIAKLSSSSYILPHELGIFLNTMKRQLDVLRPTIEIRLKYWAASCLPNDGNTVPGERLAELTVMLRAKFRTYLHALVEKLAENTHAQSATRIKKIIQDSKDALMEFDIRNRMHPLKEQLTYTIYHLCTIFEVHVFVLLCQTYWNRMGQDVLSFLEDRKENRSWYRAARVVVNILDDTFTSQMQELLGNALKEKDLEPPRSIVEIRSMLCEDAQILP